MVVLMVAYLHLYVKARHVGRISGTAAISLVERFETLDAAMRRPSPPRRITPSPRARGRAVSSHRGCNRRASAMGQALAKPEFDRAACFEREAGRDDKHEDGGQVSRGSAREYQADERAGVAGLSWRSFGWGESGGRGGRRIINKKRKEGGS